VKFFARYYWPVLIVLIAFAVLGGLYGLFEYKRRQPSGVIGKLAAIPSQQLK